MFILLPVNINGKPRKTNGKSWIYHVEFSFLFIFIHTHFYLAFITTVTTLTVYNQPAVKLQDKPVWENILNRPDLE